MPSAPPVYSPVRFWAFAVAAGVSVLGDALSSFGILLFAGDGPHSWYITEAVLAALIPPILLAPFLGKMADRFDALAVWRGALALECALFVAMPLATEHFHLTIALLACTNGIEVAAAASAFKVLPRFGGPDRLARASSHWVTVTTLAGLLAAPMGGLLYAVMGIKGLLWCNAVTFLVVLAVLALVRPPFPAEHAGEGASDQEEVGAPHQGRRRERHAALRFVRTHPVLSLLAAPVGFVVLATSIEAVAAVEYLRPLSGNDLVFGIALAAWSLGIVPGAQLGGRWVDSGRDGGLRVPVRTLVISSGVVMGAVLLAEALIPTIWVIMALFLVGGAANGAHNVGIRSAVYEHVPTRWQGQTWSYVKALMYTCAGVGNLLGTPNALYGAQAAIFMSGALCLTGCLAFAVAAVRRRG